ncbi:MAG: efflux RND transporter periplasmic adaptor subunit [Candidatus Brennerbacteria bacterium]
MQHQVHPHVHPHRASKKWFWISLIVVVLLGAGFIFAFGGGEVRPEEITVTHSIVVETISVTGRVRPASSVDLAFERSGKISRVLAKVGDRVAARTPLLELDASALRANLREAEAQVATERANLEEFRRGARPEEISVKEAELAKAEQDLANYYTAALVIVEDAYAKADDAVRVRTDALFTNAESDSPSLTFNLSDSQTQSDVVGLRRRAGLALTSWNDILRTVRASTTPATVFALLGTSGIHLATVRDFLARAIDTVNFSVGLSSATADAYKTDISVGRANVAAATTAVSSASQNLAAQAFVVAKTRSELTLIKAGTAVDVLHAQEAKVLQVEARRDAATAELSKTVIMAPFAGLVTKQDAAEGEIVAANTELVSLIAEKSLEIEAYIPEVDVGKVDTGDIAMVTFDSFGSGEVFAVRVARIEPAETVVEGVATYKTIFHFIDADGNVQERVKSGMTANVEIETERKENVLTVPYRSLRGKNGGWVAYFLNADGESVERSVTIGLRGTNGTVEIIEGLMENERVIATPPRE